MTTDGRDTQLGQGATMTSIDTRPPVETRARTYERPETRETKPSLMTTEFWAMLVGVIAIVVIYNASADRSLDLARATTLATILAVGYFVSRGLAKSGSTDVTHEDRR
jgi:hypothetical protein